MIESQSDSHVDEKENAKSPDRLEVAGEVGVGDRTETDEKEQSRRGADCTLVEDRYVYSLDPLPKIDS
ncbi:MAG: hypothetical protein RL247_840 [Actinomycetota bacterium]